MLLGTLGTWWITSGVWRVLRRGYIRDLGGGGGALGVSIDEGKAKGVRGLYVQHAGNGKGLQRPRDHHEVMRRKSSFTKGF